jgi:hypothetical protein
MDKEKLTKSKIWREIDKFISTVTNHWTAYIEFADRATGYFDEQGREYPLEPNYDMLCKDYEIIMPLETISDYIFDNDDFIVADRLIEMMGLCHDLMKSTANHQEKCKDEKFLEDCRKYTAIMRHFVLELDNLEEKLKQYHKDLKFAHRPEWGYTDEMKQKLADGSAITFDELKKQSGNEDAEPTGRLSPKVLQVLRKATKAGYVQQNENGLFLWKKTKELLSYFGYCFYANDIEKHHWKLMQKVFGQAMTKNLAQTFARHHYRNYIAQTDEEKEIDKWFNF